MTAQNPNFAFRTDWLNQFLSFKKTMCLIFDEESKNQSLVGVLWLQTRNALIKKCPYTVNFCPYKRDSYLRRFCTKRRCRHTENLVFEVAAISMLTHTHSITAPRSARRHLASLRSANRLPSHEIAPSKARRGNGILIRQH